MEFYGWVVDYVGISTLLVFLSVFLLFYAGTRKPAGLPPGPAILVPGLGNIPNIVGKDVLRCFEDMRETYGDIYSLYVGRQLLVVLNGYPLIREALRGSAHLFSHRPSDDLLANLKVTGGGVIHASGETWKQNRNFVANAMKRLGLAKDSFQEIINAEMSSLLSLIDSHGGQLFDMKEYIFYSVANIISAILTNKRYEHGDPMLNRYLRNQDYAIRKLGLASILTNAFPFLRHLPGDPFGIQVIFQERAHAYDFFNAPYVEHVETFNQNHLRDLTDYFIERNKSPVIQQQTFDIFSELFAAGTETTANTLLWLFIYLTKHPDIQKKFRKEIHDNIGDERFPTINDRPLLPYVEATISEVMRLSPVAPLAVPHAVAKDTVWNGYTIPKTATILVNIKSVLSDTVTFKNPDQFRPERFLDESGQMKLPIDFIPFGIGPRVCLGEAAAKMELFLIAVSVFQKFQILPDTNNPPDTEGVLGVTYFPKPFKVRTVRQKPY